MLSPAISRWPFVLTLALALALRLGAAESMGYGPIIDQADYNRHAVSLAAGDGYPRSNLGRVKGATAVRPAYPVFLATIYKATGQGERAARITQALLGTLTVALHRPTGTAFLV